MIKNIKLISTARWDLDLTFSLGILGAGILWDWHPSYWVVDFYLPFMRLGLERWTDSLPKPEDDDDEFFVCDDCLEEGCIPNEDQLECCPQCASVIQDEQCDICGWHPDV